ncbi:BCCT family transporter [Cytobacillus gottheilii]|uniref:BCCT family transporter n=1 Tax=Cytobacillus gottheilii TaxID=859144 RepID=UPI0009BAE37A|nr:BCCT family transporter [Cytobacillus gottheilii]
MNLPKSKKGQIDWTLTLAPLLIIIVLSFLLFMFPEVSGSAIEYLRSIFVGDFGSFYMIFGLGVFLVAVWLAFSRYGHIKLGAIEKPRFNNFAWGAMIFTSTMAADILYWSLIEWAYYFGASPFGIEDLSQAQRQDFASTYPLFHWGPIPWSFYILPAVAYGYMMFVKKRKRQTLSEACRSTIGKHADGALGKAIDIFSIVGLLAGTATTFSLATPLLSLVVSTTLGIPQSTALTILILAIIALVYTIAVTLGLKGISKLANLCVIIFLALIAIFLFFGPTRYMIESGITGVGKLVNDFFSMATWMDPLRVSGEGGSGFPQDWTVFYWAYWIAWFVATPFFIGKISEGRTIKQTIIGGFTCGLLGTFTSFIVFGNFGLFQQTQGNVDAAGMLAAGSSPSEVIIQIFQQLPVSGIALVLLAIAMVAFYASTFDAITLVVAEYSLKKLEPGQEPPKYIRVFWALIFIILPIALIFNETTLSMLQTISIVAAFPLAIIMGIIIFSFLKDLRNDTKIENKKST